MKDELKEPKQPSSLDDCFTLLNDILSNRDVFRTTLESNALAMSHHNLGRWLRNNWYLWWSPTLAANYAENGYPQEMPAIVKYFNDTWGINHADDMSGIIIQSYHRHLNNKDLGIEEQVKKYKLHWANQISNNDVQED